MLRKIYTLFWEGFHPKVNCLDGDEILPPTKVQVSEYRMFVFCYFLGNSWHDFRRTAQPFHISSPPRQHGSSSKQTTNKNKEWLWWCLRSILLGEGGGTNQLVSILELTNTSLQITVLNSSGEIIATAHEFSPQKVARLVMVSCYNSARFFQFGLFLFGIKSIPSRLPYFQPFVFFLGKAFYLHATQKTPGRPIDSHPCISL